jgi:hypothetical protein
VVSGKDLENNGAQINLKSAEDSVAIYTVAIANKPVYPKDPKTTKTSTLHFAIQTTIGKDLI